MDDKHRRVLNKKQLYLEKQLDSEDIPLVLEYLYGNGVIREKVKQDVLALSQEQAKARLLLDCLPQRGPKAFVTFIGSLVYANKDWLAKELLKAAGEADLGKFFKQNGLDPPQPAPRTEVSFPTEPVNTHVSIHANTQEDDEYYDKLDASTDIEVNVQHVTDKRMKDWFENKAYYSMQKRPRGVVLIINNIKVTGRKEDRVGAEKDEDHMKQLFEGLGFYAVSRRDRTVQNMTDDIRECTNKEANPDAFVLVIMSHGEKCKVEGSEGKRFLHYDDIKDLLSDLHAPKLAGKPKLVIIQACQTETPGADNPDTTESYGRETASSTSSGNNEMPMDRQEDLSSAPRPRGVGSRLPETSLARTTSSGQHLDQLIVTSTIGDYSAFRHCDKGSGFIRCITMVFMRHACNVDIHNLFTKVQDLMDKRRPRDRNSQTPETHRSTLRKTLFFFPGLWRRE